jgi:hypothetical protein
MATERSSRTGWPCRSATGPTWVGKGLSKMALVALRRGVLGSEVLGKLGFPLEAGNGWGHEEA